ncbi:peptidylprolyl isomerase [Acinetobacter defluvii]|uniref:Peptidyl-prolyl cis-trans isomerase n=1 Tax=Acinetobacter defluvii TaxID=1871111 RepID=A0A2S2FHU1_9GAMM|nr:FKBP-type peptidyl-prolyl cis-trans isomerase [Acinetobacter defluvii]AWL30345.1 FKBP-type peptidyl-prolyl cis-trans isomerase [Acinetobacter defluvii]NNP74020.1 peptidylprolyl isomerase [Acinetobacter defluvii]
MKKKILCLSVIMTVATSQAATIHNKSPQKDQLGYSYGYVMGKNNAETLKDIDLDAFIQGLKQGAAGQKASLTDEEMAKALTQYKQQSEAKQLIEFQKTAQENGKLGDIFLAENAKKAGIITTKSGLQYQVLQAGQGNKPRATSKVSVNYEGRLLDGTVFDSSIARGQAVDFQVSQVIAGWTEGLQLMQEGAKYRLFIPAKLAYGEIGAGDAIGPNSTLIFDVELLKVLP